MLGRSWSVTNFQGRYCYNGRHHAHHHCKMGSDIAQCSTREKIWPRPRYVCSITSQTGGPHIGPMNLTVRDICSIYTKTDTWTGKLLTKLHNFWLYPEWCIDMIYAQSAFMITDCLIWMFFSRIVRYAGNLVIKYHDDVIKWKHFPRYWPFVRGIHRSPVNSPHKGQWRGALMFSLICAWINGWVNNREAGDLRSHRVHCDVSVMCYHIIVMTSGYGKVFPTTCVCEGNPRVRWPVDSHHKSSNADLWYFLWPHWSLWVHCRWFETSWRS